MSEQTSGPAAVGGPVPPIPALQQAEPAIAEPTRATPPIGASPVEPGGPAVEPGSRRRPRGLSWWGLLGAVLAFAASLTPSLLPRPWLFEGIVAGLGAALGYALGCLVSQLLAFLIRWQPPGLVQRFAWILLGVATPPLLVWFLVLGGGWQNEVRELVGEQPLESYRIGAIGLVAVVTFALVLFFSRGVRVAARALGNVFGLVIPKRFAQVVGGVAVGLVLYWLAAGVLLNTVINVADRIYAGTNAGTDPGISQATSPAQSGSPASLVSWDSLGVQGRSFVAAGPSAADIKTFAGASAKQPIRVYAGLDSAPDARSRAELAVKELERTGAFDRKVLVVAGSTGTGWLEPETVSAVEYMWGGDTAIVGIQYSYLPSWLSTLVDSERATDAGRELFETVHAHWATLDPQKRPKLVAYGLSLGSFSIQAAFGSVGDMAARTDGALLVGTPNFAEPWATITRTRDAGSPQWQPVYRGGEVVRFAAAPADLFALGTTWNGARVAYIQHANDPVVWWSPDLLTRQPDWLAEPRGPGVSPTMRWYPLLTFLQVTVDQFNGVNVPNGQGHNYPSMMVAAWAAVTQPPDWTAARTDQLQELVLGAGLPQG
ncbi:MAG: alpha/beta hydrolase [Candidatus Nanopelagicales bacterium]